MRGWKSPGRMRDLTYGTSQERIARRICRRVQDRRCGRRSGISGSSGNWERRGKTGSGRSRGGPLGGTGSGRGGDISAAWVEGSRRKGEAEEAGLGRAGN